MRATLWIVIVSLAIIIAIGIASTVISSNVSKEFTGELEKAEDSIRAGDWEQAKNVVDSTLEKWEETCEWLQLWVNHSDTDDVSLGLERLDAAIEAQDKSLALWAGAELNEALRHIFHRDALRVGNII